MYASDLLLLQRWLALMLTLWGLYTAGLTDILRLEDKAVLNSCMHVFCVGCIARWAAKKRVCPLCKVRSRLAVDLQIVCKLHEFLESFVKQQHSLS